MRLFDFSDEFGDTFEGYECPKFRYFQVYIIMLCVYKMFIYLESNLQLAYYVFV